MAVTEERLFGKAIKRREDPRFITGRGTYVDDVKLPGMTHAAFVRSPHAHATIKKVDTARPKKMPGRRAPAAPRGRGGYGGEPVAVVIAETAFAARDGAEAVRVDYEAHPGVSEP